MILNVNAMSKCRKIASLFDLIDLKPNPVKNISKMYLWQNLNLETRRQVYILYKAHEKGFWRPLINSFRLLQWFFNNILFFKRFLPNVDDFGINLLSLTSVKKLFIVALHSKQFRNWDLVTESFWGVQNILNYELYASSVALF